jgi:fatty-acid desaturase
MTIKLLSILGLAQNIKLPPIDLKQSKV